MARRNKQSDAEELAINFIILLMLLPFAGIYFLGKNEPEKKLLGGVLLGIGLLAWMAMGA